MSKTILLKTKKELDIFMNPSRQAILRELERAGEPVTPKFLSDKLGISPSSVQFHIKKLEELELVALDHMEIIRGIQAKFYVATHAEVSLYSPENEHREECEIIMENGLMTVYKGYRKMMHEQKEINPDNWMNYGTGMTGIVFLSEEDAKEMFTMIQDFLASHKKKEAGTSPWEYGIVTYKTKA